ncbi:MAG: hypothetical protein ACRDVG_17040, partial [Jatrophihabitantaceae bacterium]
MRPQRIVAVTTSVLFAVPAWILLAAVAIAPAAHASSAGTVYITTVPATPSVTFNVRGTMVRT